ncbi:MAG: hypothetical protein M3342_11235 [Bacteroidota bacterium]|nr:hypothetical protein [Bacteroidota bacterium]
MQAIRLSTTNFQPWKTAKVQEQLNKCIIKSGYAPSHLIYKRTTMIANPDNKGRQDFYLDYATEQERFLFSALLLFDEDGAPFLLFNSFDSREVLYHFHGC